MDYVIQGSYEVYFRRMHRVSVLHIIALYRQERQLL
jgi:hypothetical protein